MKSASPSKSSQRPRRWIPYVVAAATLMLTLVAGYYAAAAAEAKDRLRFENAVQRTGDDINNRLDTYVAVLRAVTGLFAVRGEVSRAEFRLFVERLQLRERYPGVQGVGFAARVRREEADAFVKGVRDEGFADFRITPEGTRDEYYSILYIEPFDERNRGVIGSDMFAEPARRAAMQRAADTGAPAATARVTFLREPDADRQAGFLIYVPVYESGAPLGTVEERRAALKGFVYSPFRADDLLGSIFGNEPHLSVDFEVFDGDEPLKENLLHRSRRAAGGATTGTPHLSDKTIINVSGRPWLIVFASGREFELASGRSVVPYILFGGMLVSFVIFAVTRLQVSARREAERAASELRTSEARFRTVIEQSPLSTQIFSPDGQTVRVNRAWEELWGVTLEKLGGYNILEDQQLVEKGIMPYIRRGFAGEAVAVPAVKYDPEQTIPGLTAHENPVRWVSAVIYPVKNDAGEVREVVLVHEDITEQKRAEEAILFQAHLLNTVEQAVIATDLHGTVTYWNSFAERLYGWAASEALGRSIVEVTPAETTQAQAHEIFSRLKAGASWSGEFMVRRRDGSVFPAMVTDTPIYNDRGEMIGIVGVSLDVTERRRAEEELQESEARFRTLIEAVFDGVVIHEDGIIIEANKGFAAMFGYAPSEVIGKSILDLVAEEHRSVVLEKVRTGDQQPYEVTGVRKNGATFDLDVTGRAHNYRGRLVRVSALRDVTERRLAEEALRRSEEQLRARADELAEANRLKDEFLATLSHELRTPLTSILGWAKLLRMEKLDQRTAARALETIERNAQAQAQLIGDLLDVSRIITGKLRLNVQPIELASAIDSAVESVRLAAEARGVSLHVRLDPSASPIAGDPDRIQQVFWNLLTNAIKFTPRGGRVDVRLARTKQNVEVIISDTGQGISPEFLPHVFDRFRQADGAITREHGGLGLGLAIVRHLVELHGGSIRAESEGAGRGATFRLNFPPILAHDERAGRLSFNTTGNGVAAPAKRDSLKGLRVLLVDDDADSLVLLAAVLRGVGAEVTSVSSAVEAFDTLPQLRPDVLISDIGMPGIDGYELMRRVRALDPAQGGRTPAAAVTAYARAEDRAEAFAAGYQAHIPKPIEPDELIAAVARLGVKNGSA